MAIEKSEIEKTTVLVTKEIVRYMPNASVSHTILSKNTGDIVAASFATGIGQMEKVIPFDCFVQVIDGKTEITVDGGILTLELGQSVVIPAHKSFSIAGKGRFKIISTIIKSGYDL